MDIHIHNHYAFDDAKIIEILHLILKNQKTEMADLTELTAQVQKDTEVDQSAITLLQGLKKALDDAGTDPAKLKALSDQLASNTQSLADAITANTPAA